MEIMNILLVLVLIIAILINIDHYNNYSHSKKLFALLQAFFFNKNPNVLSEERVSMNVDTNKRLEEIKSVFTTFDKNEDGFITKQELRESLKRLGFVVKESEVDKMVVSVDSNDDGLIDFGEFCELYDTIFSEKLLDNGDVDGGLKEAFDVFDKDNNGLISGEELGLVLTSLGLIMEGKRAEDFNEIIKKVDADGDGMINFDEFKKILRGNEK